MNSGGCTGLAVTCDTSDILGAVVNNGLGETSSCAVMGIYLVNLSFFLLRALVYVLLSNTCVS